MNNDALLTSVGSFSLTARLVLLDGTASLADGVISSMERFICYNRNCRSVDIDL